jgi:hypothetical protein
MNKLNNVVKKISKTVRYGLVLQNVRVWLIRIGIDFSPYYFMMDYVGDTAPPLLKDDPSDYFTSFLNEGDIELLSNKIPEWQTKYIFNALRDGQKCYGLKYKGEIAAFMMINYKAFHYKTVSEPLNEKEVYFNDMYTLEVFRGRNIAPYLRYQCIQALKETGTERFISMTEYFNTPAVKYKKKLNARKLKLCLYVNLFHKFERNWTLKTYNEN